MVSMVMSAYSSAAGSALPAALPQPSTTALPPARGEQGALATGAASGDPRNARKGGTFANVFPEIKQFLQDGISLLGDLHVLINLRRKTIVATSECSRIWGHSCSHVGGATGLCGGHPPETNAPIPSAGWGQRGCTVTWSRVSQPEPGTCFSITGQLEQMRTLEIHVKLTRVEAAWKTWGECTVPGRHGAIPAHSCRRKGKRRGPAALGGGGPSVLLAPRALLSHPTTWQWAGRQCCLPAWGSAHFLRSPQLPLREFFIYFDQHNEILENTPIYKTDTSQRSHWKGQLRQSPGSALHPLIPTVIYFF